MEEGKVKLNEAVPEKEKEAIEIFSIPFTFPDIVKKEYTKRKNGGKREERLISYEKEINIKIGEAEQKGEEADAEKIVKTFLRSKNARAISRYLDRAVKKSEREEKLEVPKLEKGEGELRRDGNKDEIKELSGKEKIEINGNDIENKIKNLQKELSYLYDFLEKKAEEKLNEERKKEFMQFLDEWCDGMSGLLDEADRGKYNARILRELEGYKLKALRSARLVFRTFEKDDAIHKKASTKARKEKKKKPKAKSKKDEFYQRAENPADESLSLEKDPGNQGQHFDFIDERKEAEYENEIKKISSFEEFYEAIRKIGRMRNNSNNVISAEQIIRKIEITRKKLEEKSENFSQEDEKWGELWKKHLDLIPEICGIRNKTGELIRKEIYGEKEESGGQKEASQGKKKEFTEREERIIEIYEQNARSILEFIEKIDYIGEYDYNEEDVPNLIKINKKRFWKKYAEEIRSEKKLPGKKIEAVIEFLKNRV